ncbi:hypothetical protein ACFQZZ_14180 [Nocardia sp. GCM10030253]|uniref:hypothetical protein n=1 Tax=Nocardia sp. GCM10030253 TaxID=3273404 RepID=UPI00363C4BCE
MTDTAAGLSGIEAALKRIPPNGENIRSTTYDYSVKMQTAAKALNMALLVGSEEMAPIIERLAGPMNAFQNDHLGPFAHEHFTPVGFDKGENLEAMLRDGPALITEIDRAFDTTLRFQADFVVQARRDLGLG